MPDGEFDWGGRLRKGIGGAQRFPQDGWKPSGEVVGPKGWAVRPLKRYASWVQNVVRQFGPYPAWAQEF